MNADTDKLLDRLHALITEHVRTVLEADRKRPRKLSDWPWTDDEAAQICRHVAKLEAKLRTLTEQRGKAVEGLKHWVSQIDHFREIGGNQADAYYHFVKGQDAEWAKTRSTLASIEGDTHD